MRQRQLAPALIILLAMMLVSLWPVLRTSADTASESGTVSVEIVPPGALPPTPAPVVPGKPVPAVPAAPAVPETASPAPGTLSAVIMWLPDSAQGSTSIHGLIAVQDHRAQASGWTVRLLGDHSPPFYLLNVVVGGAGFGIPEWLYAGIFRWDVAVGASLLESPQLVTAPPRNGYSLTIHQLWFDVDPLTMGPNSSVHTLVLIVPVAP